MQTIAYLLGLASLSSTRNFGEPVDVEGHLADQRAVDAREVGGDEAGLAAVAAEDLDDADALVAADGRAQLGDGIHGTGDGGGEADAVVGPEDVVVHGLGDGDLRKAGLVEPRGVAERVVAADGDQGVDLQVLEVGDDAVGDVDRERPFLVGLPQVLGQIGLADLGGVGARGVQEGAAAAVDGPHRVPVQLPHPLAVVVGIADAVVHESGPAAAEAHHLDPLLLGPVHHLLHGRVQAGNVTAAGQDGDAPKFGAHDLLQDESGEALRPRYLAATAPVPPGTCLPRTCARSGACRTR